MGNRLVSTAVSTGLAIVTFISATPAQQGPPHLDSLSIRRAVELALEHHPSLRAAEASVRSSSASLTQARSTYYPSLNISASASRTDGAFVFNPSIEPRIQTYNSYSAALQLQQTLYDFGRTGGRVSANDSFLEASMLDSQSARDLVVMNVQLAYFILAQAQRVVDVNELAVESATKHLVQAKAFYTVGRRALFDVTKAEVDLANANVNLIKARNDLRLGRVQLENVMGIHPAGGYALTDTLSITPFSMTLDSAKGLAFSRRPELRSAQIRVEANQSLASSSWSQHLPTLSAFGTWTWSAFGFPLFSRWNAGVTLTVPVFQGFAVSGQVEQAEANADAARASLDELRESVILEVEQNYLVVKESAERIAAAAKLVEQAEQNLNLSERQYTAGVGTAIEATDAQLTLSNARITYIQAMYDYNSSLVRLRRAIGISSQ